VTAEKHGYSNVPVCVPLSLPADAAKHNLALLQGKAISLQGQLTAPGLLTEAIKPSAEGLVRKDLHFILPSLKRGQALTFTARIPASDPPDARGSTGRSSRASTPTWNSTPPAGRSGGP